MQDEIEKSEAILPLEEIRGPFRLALVDSDGTILPGGSKTSTPAKAAMIIQERKQKESHWQCNKASNANRIYERRFFRDLFYETTFGESVWNS